MGSADLLIVVVDKIRGGRLSPSNKAEMVGGTSSERGHLLPKEPSCSLLRRRRRGGRPTATNSSSCLRIRRPNRNRCRVRWCWRERRGRVSAALVVRSRYLISGNRCVIVIVIRSFLFVVCCNLLPRTWGISSCLWIKHNHNSNHFILFRCFFVVVAAVVVVFYLLSDLLFVVC